MINIWYLARLVATRHDDKVDTTDGYRPSLDTIVSFASGP